MSDFSPGAPAGRRRPVLRRVLAGLAASALAAGGALTGVTPAAATPITATATAAQTHTVTYDQYSFMVDGKRTYLWAGEFHYFRLPSPDLWRDVLVRLKAGGFNAVSYYFDWAYHSPKRGVYDFSGVRDVDKLLTMAEDLGMYVIARPGPYINAEIDSGGFPGWLTTQAGRARSNDPEYLEAADEWLDEINPIIARHQLTNGTGSVISYQVENEFYDTSAQARQYMEHLKTKARADGITVPLVGNHNNNYNTGVGALDVDMPDGYPQGFNCSNPTVWRPVQDMSWGRSPGKPLGIGEFQGGAFDPWGGPGYDKCRQLTGPDFEKVFYKQNIAIGATQQSFYMTYGGTSWGWQPDPSQVYSSYDYGASITEGRQLTAKYDENKRIGYFTQAVAPLAKTDALASTPPSSAAIVDMARVNPDTGTQFHTLRHRDSTSTATDTTRIGLNLAATAGFSSDDRDAALIYTGAWEHAGPEQGYTAGDYRQTESFSQTAGDSVSLPFTGTAVRWISSKDGNHGIADVYLDDVKVATVDGYAAAKQNQQIFYAADGLANGPHTLRIVATGQRNPAATGAFVIVDAVDVPTPAAVADTYPTVPQQPGTALTFAGRDSKIIVAKYQLGDQRLQYSTSEIMTHARIGDRDVALLYGRSGQDGETVLRYAAKPTVTVLDGDVQSSWDATRGDLRLNYKHTGLARVLVTGGERPLLLLLGTDEVAATFWRIESAGGPVLVRGPQLVRSVMGSGTTLGLTGDTSRAGDLEVFTRATTITWNGKQVKTATTPSGSRLGPLAGPAEPVVLPALDDWTYAAESPESEPGFDDGTWRIADKVTSNSITAPGSLPVLFADDYGFHYGEVWYRGRFTGTAAQTGITLSAITGRAGIFSAWLNGQFLGTGGSGAKAFTFPPGALRVGAENVLSVLVENMGHNEDYNENDSHKEARGLTGATLIGTPFAGLGWRIQGARGGEDLFDKVRGPMNNGGLYGERAGWSLPGFPDSKWTDVALPHASTRPGVSWYRTTARLDLPRSQDTSVGLRFDDPTPRHYRAQIFVNGWLVGRYVSDVGPQKTFPIPNGLLNPNGVNTIAMAVWNADTTTGGLGKVSLEAYGTHASPLKPTIINSPNYAGGRYAFDPSPQTSVALTVPDTIVPGASAEASAVVSVAAGAKPATAVSTALALPTGWTATPSTPTGTDKLVAGQPLTVRWTLTAPADLTPGGSPVTVTARYTQGSAGSVRDTRVVRTLPKPPTADTAVSALPFVGSTNGWGPVERNRSNGESAAGDGRPITIAGTVYASGLGVHPTSDVTLFLGGNCRRLTATVGVDDEVGSGGSVTFSVVADGRIVYTSDRLTGAGGGAAVDADVTGAQVVSLLTGDGGDGNAADHADWADAKLTCG